MTTGVGSFLNESHRCNDEKCAWWVELRSLAWYSSLTVILSIPTSSAIAGMLSRRTFFTIASVGLVQGRPKRSSSWTSSRPLRSFPRDSNTWVYVIDSYPYAFFNIAKFSAGVFLIFAQNLMQTRCSMFRCMMSSDEGKWLMRTAHTVLTLQVAGGKWRCQGRFKHIPRFNFRPWRPAGGASLWRGRPIPGTYYTNSSARWFQVRYFGKFGKEIFNTVINELCNNR